MNSQDSINSSGTATDARIGAALDEFLREQRDGRRMPIDQWLAAHADIADRLKTHLELIGILSTWDDPIAALIERGVLRTTPSPGYRAQVENYRVVGVVGSGGMGVVMDARHATLNRRVALKFLPPERIGDPLAVKRFISEARSMDRLKHPNIVTLIDVFEVRGVPVLVMEFVEGTSLDRRIRADSISLAEAREIFIQVMRALDHAHRRQVIHRDVKPGNILLSRNEQGGLLVKLADFGLAKLSATLQSAGPLTRSRQAVGTPQYMAPEQASGGEIDQRADLYSAGVVLKEMIAAAPICRAKRKLDNLVHELTARSTFERPLTAQDVLRRLTTSGKPRRLALIAIASLLLAPLLAWGARSLGNRTNPHWVNCASLEQQITLTGARGETSIFAPPMRQRGDSLAAVLARQNGETAWVVAGCTRGFLPNGGTLAAFNADGSLRWGPALLGSPIEWPECAEICNAWWVRHMRVYDRGGTEAPEIWIAANHVTRYPACIVRVDANSGKQLATYWHCGQFSGMEVIQNFFAPDRPAIVAWGRAKMLDAFEHATISRSIHWDQVWCILVLDPANMDGFGPFVTSDSVWPSGPPAAHRRPFAYAILDVPESPQRRPIHENTGYSWHYATKIGLDSVKVPEVAIAKAGNSPALQVQLSSNNDGGLSTPELLLDRNLQLIEALPVPPDKPAMGREVDFWRQYWRRVVSDSSYVE